MSEKPYHVFLSYNSEDRDAVEKIAVCLADQFNLRPWFDKWQLIPGEPWLPHLERGLKAAAACAVFVGGSGKGPWQKRELAAALDRQVKKPAFRVIPVLLPDAPKKEPKLPLFLAGNSWVRFLDTTDDNAFRLLECGIRGIAPGRRGPCEEEVVHTRRAQPQPFVDASNIVHPGGAMDVDSRFYILRPADEEVFQGIRRSRGLVTLRGPRQTGKTSLLMRVLAAARQGALPLRSVFVDFQALLAEHLDSLPAIWRKIAEEIDAQLGLNTRQQQNWDSGSSYDHSFSRFLDEGVFPKDNTPLLLCLDEVDRIFASRLKSEFFAAVRAFYNRGAFDASWKKVRWILCSSTEPSFFIEDLNQSPFNIGLRVELGAFSAEEIVEFALRHGLALNGPMLQKIMNYSGGRPFLVHLLLYHLALHPERQELLFDAKSAGGGVFLDHLNRYLAQFQREPELWSAMRCVIAGRGCGDVRMAGRLEAAGLVRRDQALKVICHCALYKEYFTKVLGK
jgi:hypothetical protein